MAAGDGKSLSIAFLFSYFFTKWLPFWMTFQINTQFFLNVFTKWLPATENHLQSHFSPFQCDLRQNNRVLPLCVINGYAKYEVDR